MQTHSTFLHGFLRTPSDAQLILTDDLYDELWAPHLWDYPFPNPSPGFEDWVENFYQTYSDLHTLGSSLKQRILVGYSMGGRLALQVFKKNPGFWNQLILISANTGFEDVWRPTENFSLFPERQTRIEADHEWAKKFLHLDKEMLLEQWNQREIFNTQISQDHLPLPPRDKLAKALTHWSLAYQENMRSLILEHSKKIISFVGENDFKYRKLWEPLQKKSQDLTLKIIPQASHRIFVDNPVALRESIHSLKGRICVNTLL